MIIKQLEFENFRNFKEHGCLKCSTDGKVTIIYGNNGDGKTTLHQLFQWVFYGKVHFNKTTTEKLYNLSFEQDVPYGATFHVLGRIDFDHNSISYSVSRENTYRKGIDDSQLIEENLTLLAKDEDNNWNRVDSPQEMIEKMLPSGLSEYFFFDGESMIADLRVKGKDSAAKLRKALYSMFDMDVLESALSHLGRTDLKNTVLGKLYLSKADECDNNDVKALETEIKNIQEKINILEEKRKNYIDEKKKNADLSREISEAIGENKSKTEYQKQRNELKKLGDMYRSSMQSVKEDYGNAIIDIFPKNIISRTVAESVKIKNLKSGQGSLPNGLSKRLIAYLTKMSTRECICGRQLGLPEKEHIQSFIQLMPPISHAESLSNYKTIAAQWGNGYDRSRFEKHIKEFISYREKAEDTDKKIKELDDEQKKSKDIEQLVIDRAKAEANIADYESKISVVDGELPKIELLLRKKNKLFDEATDAIGKNAVVKRKIDIIQQVVKFLSEELDKESVVYSKRLEQNIQYLLSEMLTSKREVTVSADFTVQVYDSFHDESKSEGQFAVVSFAYIGGILKMLKEEQNLSAKEYPLVLDGPFSKLDREQRQNVIDTIPKFAPQVILFSKDDLSEYMDPQFVGKIWTIQSNDEKNIAKIREGYLWS